MCCFGEDKVVSIKKLGFPVEMADSKCEAKWAWDISCQKARELSKSTEALPKGLRSQIKGLLAKSKAI